VVITLITLCVHPVFISFSVYLDLWLVQIWAIYDMLYSHVVFMLVVARYK